MKILIVDDERNIRESMKRLFALDGIDAATASDGLEATALLKDEGFDAVVLDLKMPGMRELWKDLSNRIRAISEVHELLYRADNHSSIDIREYLDRLASLLYQSYRGCFDEVRVTLDAEKVEIGLEQAVPCGMLVNEIMTNSFRHAFPRGLGRPGEIHVGLRSLPDSSLELTLSDNGIGLPSGADQGDHVGLSLISLLVDQLGGRMEVEGGGGTLYRIRFKRDGADGLDARRAGEA